MTPEDYLAVLDEAHCYYCGKRGCAADFVCRGELLFSCEEHLPTARQLRDINE